MKAAFSAGIVCMCGRGAAEEDFMQELVLELSLEGWVGCDQVGTGWKRSEGVGRRTFQELKCSEA